MESGNPLYLALNCIKYTEASSVGEVGVLQNPQIEELQFFLDDMLKKVNDTLLETRRKAVERQDSRTAIYLCNTIMREYVVVARTKGKRTRMSAD